MLTSLLLDIWALAEAAIIAAVIWAIIFFIEKFILHLIKLIKAAFRKEEQEVKDTTTEDNKKTKKLSAFAIFNIILYMVILGGIVVMEVYIYMSPMANF